LVLVKSFHFV